MKRRGCSIILSLIRASIERLKLPLVPSLICLQCLSRIVSCVAPLQMNTMGTIRLFLMATGDYGKSLSLPKTWPAALWLKITDYKGISHCRQITCVQGGPCILKGGGEREGKGGRGDFSTPEIVELCYILVYICVCVVVYAVCVCTPVPNNPVPYRPLAYLYMRSWRYRHVALIAIVPTVQK